MAKTADRRKHIRKGPPPLWRARDQLQAGRIKWPRRPLVLVDLDGTLTNPERRLHYVQGPRRPDTETKTEILRDLLRHVPKEKILFGGRPPKRGGRGMAEEWNPSLSDAGQR